MQKQVFVKAVIIMLAFAGYIRADVGVIKNGSFESPGTVWPPLTSENCPDDWNDVNLPSDKYGGWVYTDWHTHGNYNLTFFSYGGDVVFDVNEIGMVSQHVPLTREVNEITFDIRLDTSSGGWDPNMRTAVICIDGEVVWESNEVGPDVRGEYFDQSFEVPGQYKDGQFHKLSLGIRIDSNAFTSSDYYTYWDDVNSTPYCGGFGLLAGDFSHDCYVDFFDLAELVEVWLAEVRQIDERNLFGGDDTEPNGFINFRDYALYVSNYTGDTNDFAGFTDVWLEEVQASNEYNLFTADQAEPNGVINFFDFAVFAEDWERSSYD